MPSKHSTKKTIKTRPILVVGYGSIGRRHAKNLAELGFSEISVYESDLSKEIPLPRVASLSPKVLRQFWAVVICTPDGAHVPQATAAAQAGCHVFVEKPLSNSWQGVRKLETICKKNRVVSMVGCNMRFHPCLQYIKQSIAQGSCGTVYSIRHEFGHYLPDWRPGENYRQIYKSGIILNDIHEFDLLFWLNGFSAVRQSHFMYGNFSGMKGIGEDQSIATFTFANKVLGSVHCDYLQRRYNRNCKVVGSEATVTWDFDENVVWRETAAGRQVVFAVKHFDFNQVYRDEMKYFFSHADMGKKTENDVSRAAEILKICLRK